MAAINTRRVLLGAVVGGVVWTIWTMVVNIAILGSRYAAAQEAGHLLKEPRYSFFIGAWILTVFVLSGLAAWLYASARATLTPGPVTALKIGGVVGFFAGFPMNLSIATWVPVERAIPLWWMLDLWVGAVLATLVAGWLYKD